MLILKSVFNKILNNCPSVPPETGGLLGGHEQVISCAEFDKNLPVMNRAQYIPNINYLNHILAEWAQNGIEFLGMFHTHPLHEIELSHEDRIYISSIMQSVPENKKLWFPVVIPKIEIYSFVVHRTGSEIFIKKDHIIQKER